MAPKSWHNQEALSLVVKVVEEIIAARIEWSHIDDALAAHGNDFLEMQIAAFEFGNDRIEVLNAYGDGLTGWRMQLRRLEPVILDRDRQRGGVSRAGAGHGKQCGSGP